MPASPGPSMGRLVGVDLARALAVFGMYVVHIGPPLSATDGVASWIRYLADGVPATTGSSARCRSTSAARSLADW